MSMLKWILMDYNPDNQAVMCWWCKAGCHRSYGLLILFLMWGMHVHNHHLVEALLHRRLSVMRPRAELIRERHLSNDKRAKLRGAVKFSDVVQDFGDYLNHHYPQHCLSWT